MSLASLLSRLPAILPTNNMPTTVERCYIAVNEGPNGSSPSLLVLPSRRVGAPVIRRSNVDDRRVVSRPMNRRIFRLVASLTHAVTAVFVLPRVAATSVAPAKVVGVALAEGNDRKEAPDLKPVLRHATIDRTRVYTLGWAIGSRRIAGATAVPLDGVRTAYFRERHGKYVCPLWLGLAFLLCRGSRKQGRHLQKGYWILIRNGPQLRHSHDQGVTLYHHLDYVLVWEERGGRDRRSCSLQHAGFVNRCVQPFSDIPAYLRSIVISIKAISISTYSSNNTPLKSSLIKHVYASGERNFEVVQNVISMSSIFVISNICKTSHVTRHPLIAE